MQRDDTHERQGPTDKGKAKEGQPAQETAQETAGQTAPAEATAATAPEGGQRGPQKEKAETGMIKKAEAATPVTCAEPMVVDLAEDLAAAVENIRREFKELGLPPESTEALTEMAVRNFSFAMDFIAKKEAVAAGRSESAARDGLETVK